MSNSAGWSEANRRKDLQVWRAEWNIYIREAQPIELPQKTFESPPHRRYIKSNNNNNE